MVRRQDEIKMTPNQEQVAEMTPPQRKLDVFYQNEKYLEKLRIESD